MCGRLIRTFRVASCAIGIFAIGIFALAVLGASAQPMNQNDAHDPWPGLAKAVFNGRFLEDGSSILALDMPARAEDAAIVPLTVRSTLPATDPRRLTTLTIVIDENPAPVGPAFTFGPHAVISSISTRVRVNSYTNVHAVAELSDGRLYVVKTYVKASGGCSAPASKNVETTRIGQMRLRHFTSSAAAAEGRLGEAQIMIHHPNHSGLQMDQITQLYIPAFFVGSLKMWQGDDLMFAMQGGISLSENPNVRFTYLSNGATTFRAEAVDTKEQMFKGVWPVAAQMERAGSGN
jgi:sulfur-oxidizing protein SoxY